MKEKTFQLKFLANGKADPRAIVQGKHYRFTLLTDRILRLEYDPEGIFEDRPSQVVLYRNQSVPAFRVRDDGERLEIDTDRFHLTYDYTPDDHFTANTLQIAAKNKFTNYGHVFRFGERQYGDPPRHHNLYGTARTLSRYAGLGAQRTPWASPGIPRSPGIPWTFRRISPPPLPTPPSLGGAMTSAASSRASGSRNCSCAGCNWGPSLPFCGSILPKIPSMARIPAASADAISLSLRTGCVSATG